MHLFTEVEFVDGTIKPKTLWDTWKWQRGR